MKGNHRNYHHNQGEHPQHNLHIKERKRDVNHYQHYNNHTRKDLGIAEDKIIKTPRYAWVVLVITYFASITAPLGQFKITAIASDIIPSFSLNYASFGLLMTCLAVIGALLAFPAAFICRKIGLKSVCLLAVGCICLGGLVEVVSGSIELLYVGRFIEGLGLGLIGVASPAIISIWFPEKTRGLALGVWCTWVPMAITIDFNVAPIMAQNYGWQSVFYGVSALSLVAFLLFAIFYKEPFGQSNIPNFKLENSIHQCLRYLKNPDIWLLGFTFLIFNFIQGGIVNTYYPSYLESLGFDMPTAGLMTSVITLIGFVMNPLAGAISDKLPLTRKFILVSLFAITSVVGFLIGYPASSSTTGIVCIWVFIVLMGFSAAFGGGGSRPLAPCILSASAMAATMGMAVMQLTQCLGQMLAPVYGVFLDCGISWSQTALILVVPISFTALIASFFICTGKLPSKRRHKHNYQHHKGCHPKRSANKNSNQQNISCVAQKVANCVSCEKLDSSCPRAMNSFCPKHGDKK